MIDIFILTFNRLPYLQKCIWSILAGTQGQYRIVVLDDGSTDGTREWLTMMRGRNNINIALVFPKRKLGTAKGFNELCSHGEGGWFAFANDDMWFHRGWLVASIAIAERFPDCGMVSFYDYTAVRVNKIKQFDTTAIKLEATGLGATWMHRPLWNTLGGFHLSGNRIMGFFASSFCKLALKTDVKRSGLYMPIPAYAHNMDLVQSKLSERSVLEGYIKHRHKYKTK